MHIADRVLSLEVCAVTGVMSIGALSYSLYKLRDSLADRTVPMTGMMSALIFAGQMVNFPIGTPVSGHLLGGVLAAVVLGPWAGCLALTLVLLVQCALFADGGITALGANMLHMAVIGSMGGYAIYALVRRMFRDNQRGILVGAVLASWLSVMAAAAMFCVEFRLSWLSSNYDFTRIFTLMVSFHSLIGVGEALITGCVLAFVLKQRPDLIYSPETSRNAVTRMAPAIVAGLVCALAVAGFLSPFASGFPDGLEAVAEKTTFNQLAGEPTVLFLNDYRLPLSFSGWQNASGWEKMSVSLAGLLGTSSVFLIAILLGRTLRLQTSTRKSRDAE